MSITAAENFRQHVNRMSTLQAELVRYVDNGTIDYSGLADLGSRSGFDFTPAEAKQVLSTASDELSDFEMELVSGGSAPRGDLKSTGKSFGRFGR